MMIKKVRFLVVAASLCALLGSGVPATAEGPLPALSGLAAEAGPSGPVIHLRVIGEVDTVHYSPQPGVWIVEMPEASWEQADGLLSEPDLGIDRAELVRVEEFGKRLSRLTVWLSTPAQMSLAQSDNGLDLLFSSLTSSAPPIAVLSEEVPVPTVAEAEAAATVAEPVLAQDSGPGNAASLLAVAPVSSGDGLVIELTADGPLHGQSFTLPSPERLVVDFHGVVNRVDRNIYTVSSAAVERVRVAQFRAVPEPITRLVIDLKGPAEHSLSVTPEGATVVVGAADHVAIARPPEGDSWDETGTISIVRSQPAESEEVIAEPAPAALDSSLFELPESTAEPAVATIEPVIEESYPEPIVDEPEPVEDRSPWVAEPSQLIEKAAAAEVLDTGVVGAETFEATEVESQEQQFTGEPITLTLKDADIKDVLRTFSELTQLNIVLDPDVSGSVTVELRDVPWDQALDLILRINNLDYLLENNVLRVAPIRKLAAEKEAKAQFLAQQEQAEPLKTVLKRLSYARSTYVATLLAGDSYLLSPRGSVTTDERTNTLIIRDVVDRVEGILVLIESLDQPTPQVVIEARIVETTRQFSHQLGVTWGFQGIMDQEHGNDTGLSFPNSVTSDGQVNLFKGTNGVLGFTFADILNTFNLDFALGAAEAEGLVTIVSTPRITTQNLQSAFIRSGLQIPIQTVANNTVTVQYVDATLRLQVTPQITAEGTVNLDLNINKREPALAAGVEGGQNAPIFTREAQTQLLVRDGGTTVIAGIYQINDQDQVNSVPGLGKVPIIKYLFRNKEVFKRHDELLIFITPRIVKY